jgi:hypothetical protein
MGVSVKAGTKELWLLASLAVGVVACWWGAARNGMFGFVWAFLAGLLITVVTLKIKQKLFKEHGFFVRLAMGVVMLLIWMTAYMLGQNSATRAFNSCISNGEEVRTALQAYYQKHKAYPNTLSDLNSKLPCDIDLRPIFLNTSVLDYERTALGYKLYFGDSFASHTATESQPFEAHK